MLPLVEGEGRVVDCHYVEESEVIQDLQVSCLFKEGQRLLVVEQTKDGLSHRVVVCMDHSQSTAKLLADRVRQSSVFESREVIDMISDHFCRCKAVELGPGGVENNGAQETEFVGHTTSEEPADEV